MKLIKILMIILAMTCLTMFFVVDVIHKQCPDCLTISDINMLNNFSIAQIICIGLGIVFGYLALTYRDDRYE